MQPSVVNKIIGERTVISCATYGEVVVYVTQEILRPITCHKDGMVMIILLNRAKEWYLSQAYSQL